VITTKRGRQPTAAVEPHARKVENTLHEAGERSLIERKGPVAVDHAVGVRGSSAPTGAFQWRATAVSTTRSCLRIF